MPTLIRYNERARYRWRVSRAVFCYRSLRRSIRCAGTFMKSTLYFLVVLVLGGGFGFFFAQPSPVHAQMKVVRVTRLHLAVGGGSGAAPVDGPVVGFYCSRNGDGTTDCYIASQP
jgi:hypothetical protein